MTRLFATILLVGDSHTYQSFGRTLDQRLGTLPNSRVATFASWGTSPGGWLTPNHARSYYFEHDPDGTIIDQDDATTPQMADLLARFHPKLTVIALGANLYGAPSDYSSATVREMAAIVGRAGSQCLWVGPPDSRLRTGPLMDEVYATLQRESADYCQFMDSRLLTHYPANGGDGLHYDYLGAEGFRQTSAWAESVFDRVKQILVTRRMSGHADK